jgi:type II secretory pathway pseudopilin PulG
MIMKPIAKGLNLKETAVSTGIVVILAAVLTPVFAQARQNAKNEATIRTLQGVAMSTYIYAFDNDHYLVTPIDEADDGSSWSKRLMPYLKNPDLLWDPANRVPGLTDAGAEGESDWMKFTTVGANTYGYLGSWGSDQGRMVTAQEDVNLRMAFTVTRHGERSYGHAQILNWLAPCPMTMTPCPDCAWSSQVNSVYSAAKLHGLKFPALYGDLHAGMVSPGSVMRLSSTWGESDSCIEDLAAGESQFAKSALSFWGDWKSRVK